MMKVFVNTWVIHKTAKNPDLSWRVVEFLSGKEGQQIALDILRNPIYKGYKTTNKEHVSDYLSQTIIKHDKSEYVYVKCDFEPIIPEQEWEACQRRLKRASAFLDGGVSEAYGFRGLW